MYIHNHSMISPEYLQPVSPPLSSEVIGEVNISSSEALPPESCTRQVSSPFEVSKQVISECSVVGDVFRLGISDEEHVSWKINHTYFFPQAIISTNTSIISEWNLVCERSGHELIYSVSFW